MTRKALSVFWIFYLWIEKVMLAYPFVVIMCSTVTKKSRWFVEIKDKTWLYPTWVVNTSSQGALAWSGSRLSLTHDLYEMNLSFGLINKLLEFKLGPVMFG